MQLNFAIKYDSGTKEFTGLQSYYGAVSLLGVSQVLMISLNAFFNREIVTQAPAAKGFRILLGTAKKGSWEQAISVIVTDPRVIEVARDLGKDALYDLIKWALLSGVGIPFVLSFRKSRKRVRELERENEDLSEKLDEALKRIHQPVKHQGLTVQIMSGRTVLATFDDMSLQFLETEVQEEETHLREFSVSRFNTRTGTGRLIDSLESVSVPFVPVDKLSRAQNNALADNLAMVSREIFQPIRMVVSRVTDASGHVKRFRVHRVLA